MTIDRKNPKQAIPQIQKLGRFINEKKYAAVIYPEGTRSRSGEMRAFKPAGLVALLEAAPDALLVPLTINRAYQFTQKGLFPLTIGVKMEYIVHPPLENTGDKLALISQAEAAVRSADFGRPVLHRLHEGASRAALPRRAPEVDEFDARIGISQRHA